MISYSMMVMQGPQYHISTFDLFTSLSGHKIHWTKSSLMHLNSTLSFTPLPSNIPIGRPFRYLGVDIFPSTSSIATKKFQGMYNQVEKDLEHWPKLPNSLQAHISIVKMDVFPHINVYSSMVPLAPPKGYWEKLCSLISRFVWNGKRPRLKLKTLQRDGTQGGLALPNFKMYFWSIFFGV